MNEREFLWVFDPGHGIDTLGKCSDVRADGTRYYEWKHTRLLVKRIIEEMRKAGERNFVTTVTEDKDVALKTRCARANAAYARHGRKDTVLVSIHSNAAGCGGWQNARGWSIWTSPGVTRADTVATFIWKAMDTTLREAGYHDTFADAEVKKGQRPMRADYSDGDPDYEARFTMLTGTAMPAVLIENLFHDNVKDVDFLTSEAGVSAIAKGVAKGLIDYKNSLA